MTAEQEFLKDLGSAIEKGEKQATFNSIIEQLDFIIEEIQHINKALKERVE